MLRSPYSNMVKATIPNGKIVGMAIWIKPGAPVFNLHIRDEKSEIKGEEEGWIGVNQAEWDGMFASADIVRNEVMGDEPHW